MDRPASFAGSWYPDDPQTLRTSLQHALPPTTPHDALGLILPHAGHRFCLSTMAAAAARAVIPPHVILLCPNHRVPPPVAALWPSGHWHTPLARTPVDSPLAQRLLDLCPHLSPDPQPHLREHAIELILPLLQHLQPNLRIVPIVLNLPTPQLQDLAHALATLHRDHPFLLVASSDMNHHEPAHTTHHKDARALSALLDADPQELLRRCDAEQISMCGRQPAATLLWTAHALGHPHVELAAHSHSGDINGRTDSVVGYASLLVRLHPSQPH